MKNFETCYIDGDNAVCYGKENLYDHPKVYLKIDPQAKEVLCPYCSKRFIQKEDEA